MNAHLAVMTAATACALGLSACTVDNTTSTPVNTGGNQATEPASTPSESPSPDGTYKASCDMLLFAGPNDETYFVGQARITNTGNVAADFTTTTRWQQAGSKPIKKSKTVSVDAGDTKRVNLKYGPVSDYEISAYQATYDTGSECKTSVKIVGY